MGLKSNISLILLPPVFSCCFTQRQNLNASGFSPFQADQSKNGSARQTQLPQSPYFNPNVSGGNIYNRTPPGYRSYPGSPTGQVGQTADGSPVYGDTTLISPQKRAFKRFL